MTINNLTCAQTTSIHLGSCHLQH